MVKIILLPFLFLLSLTGRVHTDKCEIKTSMGDFVIELLLHNAPITTSNFMKYVDAGHYNGTDFYRVQNLKNQDDQPIKIELIQGGLTDQAKRFPPIEHENTEQSGILHKDGVVSMARANIGTASSAFFICINDQPELDYGGKRNPDGQGFAAFAKVVEGMDVVRKIYSQPFEGSNLTPKIVIHSISRKH